MPPKLVIDSELMHAAGVIMAFSSRPEMARRGDENAQAGSH